MEEIVFFPWSEKYNQDWCNKYNFELKELKQDSGNRLYAEWIRK
jgi:hypothetical protein